MTTLRVDPGIAGTRFAPHEFAWDWPMTQLIARAAGCAIDEPLDRAVLLPAAIGPGHPMILFNGALLARNRPEVMECLVGGYDAWQEVGRWGSGAMTFLGAIPPAGRGRVSCGFTEVGASSKGHALVRFSFEIDDAESGRRLAEGWMLLFCLGCGVPGAGRVAPPRIAIPEGSPDVTVGHETPANVTFDWGMASGDWNTTHLEPQTGNPAPLVHGPRNMALVLHDAARAFAGGRLERVTGITLGSMPAPHFPRERTESRFWRSADDSVLGRLVVPEAARLDGGAGEKVVIDQIEIVLGPS
jgi:hypothetical protein